MQLTPEQKADLKELVKSRGFKVLLLIHEQATNDLGRKLLTSKLTESDIETIKKNQTYMRAREDFFQDVQKHINEVYIPKV